MGNWGWGGVRGLGFGGIEFHTCSSEDCIIRADLGLPDSALGTVEDGSVLAHCLHELYHVSVMLLTHSATNAYIVVDHNDAGKAVCHLFHAYLENILRLNGMSRNLHL